MEWIPLESRLISEIAYDEPARVLYVRLRNRQLKRYENTSLATFENLRNAASPGFYFTNYISRRLSGVAGYGRSRFRPMRLAKMLTFTLLFLATNNLIMH